MVVQRCHESDARAVLHLPSCILYMCTATPTLRCCSKPGARVDGLRTRGDDSAPDLTVNNVRNARNPGSYAIRAATQSSNRIVGKTIPHSRHQTTRQKAKKATNATLGTTNKNQNTRLSDPPKMARDQTVPIALSDAVIDVSVHSLLARPPRLGRRADVVPDAQTPDNDRIDSDGYRPRWGVSTRRPSLMLLWSSPIQSGWPLQQSLKDTSSRSSVSLGLDCVSTCGNEQDPPFRHKGQLDETSSNLSSDTEVQLIPPTKAAH